jgi:hypothetical protein
MKSIFKINVVMELWKIHTVISDYSFWQQTFTASFCWLHRVNLQGLDTKRLWPTSMYISINLPKSADCNLSKNFRCSEIPAKWTCAELVMSSQGKKTYWRFGEQVLKRIFGSNKRSGIFTYIMKSFIISTFHEMFSRRSNQGRYLYYYNWTSRN